MNLNLTAKTAVFTRASRGIGLATAQTLIDDYRSSNPRLSGQDLDRGLTVIPGVAARH